LVRLPIPRDLRDLPREVGALVAVAFAVAIGFGIVAPAIPVFARDFGVGRAASGAVISAFAFARLASALLGGRLVDLLGERVVLAVGIGIVAVSSALAGVAQSYTQLIVLRGVGGVGSAMFTVSALSLLLRSVGPDQRGKASGMFTGGFLLGGIAGPALGGLVVDISIRLPFFLYAGTLAVAGTIAMTMLRKEPPRAGAAATERPQRVGLRDALRQPAFRAAMVTNLADQWAVLGVRSALIPLFVAEELHRGGVWIGIGFAIVAAMNAAVLLPAGRLADRLGRKPVMIAGCSISATAMVVLALEQSLAGYLIAMAVFGFGSGLLDVAPAAVVGDVIGGGGGTAVAAYQMAGDTGTVVGPVVTGRLADTSGYGAAFATTGGVLAVAAALVALAPETYRTPAQQGSDERAAEVREEVIDALQTDRKPDQV
jgi:MFS family permease